MLLAIKRVHARSRMFARADPDLTLFGAALIACIVATLLMIDTMGLTMGAAKMFYVLAGLSAAYAGLNESTARAPHALVGDNALRD
jgi:hypothetical protein